MNQLTKGLLSSRSCLTNLLKEYAKVDRVYSINLKQSLSLKQRLGKGSGNFCFNKIMN